MIEIKLATLRSPLFAAAYQKLMKTPGLPPKVAYHIARVGVLLEQEQRAANESHDKLVQEWAELQNENGQTFWKIPDDKIGDWTKANTNFHEATATIEKRKLLFSELAYASLTPEEILALEPVVSGLDIADENEGGQNGSEKSIEKESH